MPQPTEFKRLPFAVESRVEYGPARGSVKLHLTPRSGSRVHGKFTVFFTEHNPIQRHQHVVHFADVSDKGDVKLPSGVYTLQVHVPGFETTRRLVEVEPEQTQTIHVSLVPRKQKVRSFAERLSHYGLDAKSIKIKSLEVPQGETLALNYMTHRDKDNFRILESKTIADIKKWIGSDDKHFNHSSPVLGKVQVHDISRVAERVRKSEHPGKISVDEIKSLDVIANEYIHGNARSVAQYADVFDKLIVASQVEWKVRMPIFFFNVVTIGPGATLEVGNGSAVFTCDELRIHKTGTLKPVGSMKIEIGTYKEFG